MTIQLFPLLNIINGEHMSNIKARFEGKIELSTKRGKKLGDVHWDVECKMRHSRGEWIVDIQDNFQNNSRVNSADTLVQAITEAIEDNFALWEQFAVIEKEDV